MDIEKLMFVQFSSNLAHSHPITKRYHPRIITLVSQGINVNAGITWWVIDVFIVLLESTHSREKYIY